MFLFDYCFFAVDNVNAFGQFVCGGGINASPVKVVDGKRSVVGFDIRNVGRQTAVDFQ